MPGSARQLQQTREDPCHQRSTITDPILPPSLHTGLLLHCLSATWDPASSIYLLSVLIMIMATMPDRKSTIITLFTMENQWIWSSVIFR